MKKIIIVLVMALALVPVFAEEPTTTRTQSEAFFDWNYDGLYESVTTELKEKDTKHKERHAKQDEAIDKIGNSVFAFLSKMFSIFDKESDKLKDLHQ